MASNSYVFTDSAKTDIEEIIKYIRFTLLNKEASRKFYNKVVETINIICEFPECYKKFEKDSLSRTDVRQANVGKYILFYSFEKEKSKITILRIIYGRRSIDDIVKKL